jgi:hypothetical protein
LVHVEIKSIQHVECNVLIGTSMLAMLAQLLKN